MRRILPALAAVLAASCGYVGEPLPPLANVPSRVTDLSAVQRGNRLIARFTIPRLTSEGMSIKGDLKLDFRIGPPTDPLQEDLWAAGAAAVAQRSSAVGAATYEIPTAPWTGKDAVIGVRIVGENGKSSRWSNLVTVPVVAPPDVPGDVRAVATAGGVRLTWQARGADFRVFRRTGAEPFVSIADAAQSPWIDPATEFGTSYTYQVQTIEKLPGDREAESELSSEAAITPRDTFPPAVPAGLRATATANSVELSWDPVTDSDLAGYRVYRGAAGGPTMRIAETTTVPAYSDHAVETGKTYQYSITAVDQAGNESAHSPAAEVTVE